MSERKVVDFQLQGGLDLTSTKASLYQQPGVASKLINYENGIYGGYRRINGDIFLGYGVSSSAFNPTVPLTIDNITLYANGFTTVAGNFLGHAVYSSVLPMWAFIHDPTHVSSATLGPYHGNIYLDPYPAGDPVLSVYLNSAEDPVHLVYVPDQTTPFGLLAIIVGSGVYILMMDGTGGVLNGDWGITPSDLALPAGSPILAGGVVYKERLVVWAGSSIYWSNRYDPYSYTGASAGVVDVGDDVVACASFREKLYIFCRDSIFVLDNIDGAPRVDPVTRNVGCFHANTIQEIGGDLVFLATDGVRSLGATSRIGDIETAILSKKITPLTDEIIRIANDGGYINSIVLKRRNQYRIYATDPLVDDEDQLGIIGTFSHGESGATFNWSEVRGFNVRAIAEADPDDITSPSWTDPYLSYETSVVFHSDTHGFFFRHDSGDQMYRRNVLIPTFPDIEATNVVAKYQSHEINFGSSEVRKTMHAASIGVRPEDDPVNLTLSIQYDNGSPHVHNPPDFTVDTVYKPMIIGEFLVGESVLGASDIPFPRTLIEGGGYSCRFKIESDDANGPYSIDSITVEYIEERKYR